MVMIDVGAGVESMARSGSKKKFKGYDPSKPAAPHKEPDDRVRTSRQPHRRALKNEDRLNERAESPLGRLWLERKISYDQLLAGERFCVVVGAYRATIVGPRATAGSGRGTTCLVDETNDARACNFDPDTCACLRKRQAYNDAFHALMRTKYDIGSATRMIDGGAHLVTTRLKPRRVAFIVSRVAIHREEIEEQDLVYLKAGLSALHRLWS